MLPVATEPRHPRRRLRVPRDRIGELLRSERGVTLIELLIYLVASLFVLTAVITFMLATFGQENQTQSRATTNDQAEQGLEQLVTDLRQAVTSVSITNPTASTTEIAFDIPTAGAPTNAEQVEWTCPNAAATHVSSCTRVLTESGGTTITKAEIDNVVSMSFSAVSSNGTAMTLPVINSTSIASVGMTLSVQTSNYATGNTGNQGTALAGTSGTPILLQATADLNNFA
jgi:Tfp pilus assembly protein PilW